MKNVTLAIIVTTALTSGCAYQEVAQAFGPAVQKLIEDVVQNPKFKQIAN